MLRSVALRLRDDQLLLRLNGPYIWIGLLLCTLLLGISKALVLTFITLRYLIPLILTRIGQPPRARLHPVAEDSKEAEDEILDAVIVGGGAAGLACGAVMKEAGLRVIVLEAAAKVGLPWNTRYDRLHLHTDKFVSSLPFLPFPSTTPLYPSKDDVAAYLAAYQQALRIPVEFNTTVKVATRTNKAGRDEWNVETTDGRVFRGRHLVVATGEAANPTIASFKDESKFTGEILHSTQYTNAARWRGKRVLIVGIGNSGAELCMDVHEHGALGSVVVRSPQLIIDRDTIPGINAASFLMVLLAHVLPDTLVDKISPYFVKDLTAFGIPKSTVPIQHSLKVLHKPPLLDIGVVKLIQEAKLAVLPNIVKFLGDGRSIEFANGTKQEFDVVVKATGYSPSFRSWLQDASKYCGDEDCPPVVLAQHQLFFVGFHDHLGKLREIGLEAHRVAAAVAH